MTGSKTRRVAVLMGGRSAEREVSLSSGRECARALRTAGFDVTEIDAGPRLAQDLADAAPDVAFNALHGRWGEDGSIQGILEYLQIPYTHSGVLASALAMHKERAKDVLRRAGVPVADGIVASRMEAAKRHLMAPPYVVKPVNEGSSVGVFIVREDHRHPPQELMASDWSLSETVLVERFVPGRELTCAAMGDKALDVIDIVPADALKFYNYEAKYAKGGSIHILPAALSPNVYQSVQTFTLKAHQALGCRGVSRADFRLDERADGSHELVCLEVNTQPGMTETSLVPDMARHAGMTFGELVRWIVEDASCNR